jgi:hypothetical protein
VGVGVGAAPHEPERAQSRLVEFLQSAGIGAQVLGALEVQDGRQYSLSQALFEFTCSPYDPERSGRFRFQTMQALEEPVCEAPCILRIELRGVRDLVAVLGDGQRRLLGPAVVLWVGRVASEKASAKAALSGPRQVDVTEVAPFKESAPLATVGEMEVE